MKYLFFLGRKFELNFAELQYVLEARFQVTPQLLTNIPVAIAELESLEQAVQAQILLGGTMKVVEVKEIIDHTTTEAIEEHLAVSLIHLNIKNVSFGVAEIGRDSLDAVSLKHIKHILRQKEISTRFVDGPRNGLSASVLLHQNVEEVCAVRSADIVYIGLTIAVQNIDDWTVRDREKPRSDRKRGMLPPKLARIMVNLASPGADQQTILDPFCGTGTVLLEALMVGKNAIGSDVRADAVEQSRSNCAWFVEKYPEQNHEYIVLESDATHLDQVKLKQTIDVIATEGYLGPAMPESKKIAPIFTGLEKLYWGSFKKWTSFLNHGARICIALPLIDIGKTQYSLASLVDRANELGYNSISEPFIYDRPQTIVKRQIFILEYTSKKNTK